jgi:hypothetical protein
VRPPRLFSARPRFCHYFLANSSSVAFSLS